MPPEPADYADAGECIDTKLSCLANPRRRMLVRLLSYGPLIPRDAANWIAYAESDTIDSAKETPPDERHACYVSLTQTHIPTLQDAEIIAEGKEGPDLLPGPEYERARALLAFIDDQLAPE